MHRKAIVATDSWAGRIEHPVIIVGETPKRYRVMVEQKTKLPGGWLHPGETKLVPKCAVWSKDEDETR